MHLTIWIGNLTCVRKAAMQSTLVYRTGLRCGVLPYDMVDVVRDKVIACKVFYKSRI